MRPILVTSWSHIRSTIFDCFKDDQVLLSKFHVRAGESLDSCVEDTFDAVTKKSNTDFYALMENEEVAGFFGHERHNGMEALTSFFLREKYRTEEGKAAFWEAVDSVMGDRYFCGLYSKNVRAVKFIEKRGAQFLSGGMDDKSEFLVYEINKKSCPSLSPS